MFDDGDCDDIALPEVPIDPLKFRDERRYADRIKDARTKTGLQDAVKLGIGKLDGLLSPSACRISISWAARSAWRPARRSSRAWKRRWSGTRPSSCSRPPAAPACRKASSSLMQLPRTTVAVQMLREAKQPYIVVLTNPTTGGVTASYAMLGDVHIAEPGALIGFAGPRVIEQTIREKLPEGFQRAEYLEEHGMVDMVVHRHKLRAHAGAALPAVEQGAGGRSAASKPAAPMRGNSAGQSLTAL